jgi:hypothetical protein
MVYTGKRRPTRFRWQFTNKSMDPLELWKEEQEEDRRPEARYEWQVVQLHARFSMFTFDLLARTRR